MIYQAFIGLVANASMLLGLSVIHDAVALRKSRSPGLQKIYMGILLGLIGIALMKNPWIFGGGIIFDTRTILLSISGLFFGFVPTLIAVLMTAAVRIQQGGGGVYMGVYTITSSAFIGLLWRYLHQKRNRKYDFVELYTLGQTVHLVMVALMFTLPKASQLASFQGIAIPVLVIYPFATVLLGRLHAIHLQRLAESEALQQSEELFNSIANTSPPIWMSGLDKNCYWFNKSWLEFTGRTLEQEQGNGWLEGVHPDDQEKCIRQYSTYFDSRQDFLIEYRMRRHDGMYRWVLDRGKPRYDKAGEFLGYVGTCIDQTDLRRVQDTLKSTEEEYSLFFNNAADLFAVGNQDGHFIRLNDQWEKTLGFTKDELMAKPYLEFIHPDDLQATIKAVENAYINSLLPDFVNRYRCKDGDYRWIEWRAYLVKDKLYCAARDITNRIEAEKEIRRLNRDLEQKVEDRTAELRRSNEELETFISSVAHDLKAPLRAIEGFNNIIVEDYAAQMSEEGRTLLDRISENAKQMANLINDLLLFSRVAKAEITPVSLEMKKIAQSVYEELCTEDQKKRFSLVVTELPIAKGDKKLIRQVLENLIDNAIKFTEPKPNPQITITGTNTGVANIYSIKDNGVGFNPKYSGHVFELFSRMHNGAEFSGTGVGLAIVKKIIQRHGGRVWAETIMGYGTELFFSLPVK